MKSVHLRHCTDKSIIMSPIRYLHTGNVWSGIPVNQYGFGVLKAQPYQKGYGVYRTKGGRRQRGYGFGSALLSIGRMLVPKILPVARRIGKRVVRQGIKALPKLVSGQTNRKLVVRNLAKAISQQAIDTALEAASGATGTRGSSQKRRNSAKPKGRRRLRRRGQFDQA